MPNCESERRLTYLCGDCHDTGSFEVGYHFGSDTSICSCSAGRRLFKYKCAAWLLFGFIAGGYIIVLLTMIEAARR